MLIAEDPDIDEDVQNANTEDSDVDLDAGDTENGYQRMLNIPKKDTKLFSFTLHNLSEETFS